VLSVVASKAYLFAQPDGKRVAQSDIKRVELNLTEFRKCTVSFQPPKAQSKWNTKPIWIPAYPTSLKEFIHKSVINQLTGLKQGGKSYYASAKAAKLRFCFGSTETATCSNVHPMIEMAGGPDKKSDKFYSEYVMAIRNPMAAIPAYINEKQIKYHGTIGQMTEDAWRKFRDEYFNGLIKEWITFLETWTSSNYMTGMYLVYEELHDVDQGPKALKRLRSIFRNAGFVVAPEVDVSCIWFNAIGEENIQQNHMIKYEYKDYIPGYTKAQKEIFLTTLSTFVDKSKGNEELTSILQKYSNTIMQTIRIDEIEYVNGTLMTSQ